MIIKLFAFLLCMLVCLGQQCKLDYKRKYYFHQDGDIVHHRYRNPLASPRIDDRWNNGSEYLWFLCFYEDQSFSIATTDLQVLYLSATNILAIGPSLKDYDKWNESVKTNSRFRLHFIKYRGQTLTKDGDYKKCLERNEDNNLLFYSDCNASESRLNQISIIPQCKLHYIVTGYSSLLRSWKYVQKEDNIIDVDRFQSKTPPSLCMWCIVIQNMSYLNPMLIFHSNDIRAIEALNFRKTFGMVPFTPFDDGFSPDNIWWIPKWRKNGYEIRTKIWDDQCWTDTDWFQPPSNADDLQRRDCKERDDQIWLFANADWKNRKMKSIKKLHINKKLKRIQS